MPIVKFSVDWWNTLHQPASISRLDGPTIHSSILMPLLVMAVAYTFFFAALLVVRMRTEVLKRRALGVRLARAAR